MHHSVFSEAEMIACYSKLFNNKILLHKLKCEGDSCMSDFRDMCKTKVF